MEHKKGISNEFFPDDDFDRMLEEKTKGWQKGQTAAEILDSQKSLGMVSDSKVQNVANAEAESLSLSSSSETPDDASANQSSDANDAEGQPSPEVVEHIPADSPIYKPNEDGIVEAAPTSAEVDEAAEEEKLRRIESDPTYSRSIIEGKVQKTVIRGIATGPWARQTVETETISKGEILKGLGHEGLQIIWNKATASAKHCNGDVERLIHHIALLQQAAFVQEWYRDAYLEVLREVIANGSEAERQKAETAYAKMFKEQSKRIKPDGSKTVKGKNLSDAKPKAVKVEKLAGDTKKTIDVLVTLKVDYDQVIERLKHAGKMNQPALDYIKTCYGKA